MQRTVKRLSLWKIAFPTMAVMLSLTSRAQVTPPGAKTQNPTNTSAPHIQFAEPLYDFGKVAAGGIVEHDFVFTNTGDAPLTIR